MSSPRPRLLVPLLLLLAGCSQSGSPGDPMPVAVPSPPAAVGPPLFEDVTRDTGIDFTYRNGEEAGHFAIIESLGGGVALIDYDKDGKLDVFLPGGGRYEGKTVLGHPGKLFRNLGGFRFQDVSAAVGLTAVAFPYSHGAAAFDYDCDGWPDLLVTGYNRLVLLHNEPDPAGGRRFRDVTTAAGLTERLWSTSAAWADLDGDGYPEIYVAHYGDWGFETNHPTDCTYDGKTRDVCQPRRFQSLSHSLYRNKGDGTFADVSAALQPRRKGKGIGVVTADLDGDGRPDVYAANDTDDNFLFLNRGSTPGRLNLEEVGLTAGVALDDRGVANGSMGVAVGDYDRSGRGSIVVTNYEQELTALYQNRSSVGQPRFTFASQTSGLAVVGGRYVGWGVGFFDYDLDGGADLMTVNGHAIRFPTKLERRQLPLLLRNEKGRFRETTATAGAYFTAPHNARGLAVGDLDNDGRPDAVVGHLNEPVAVLRNVGPTDGRHWLGVELCTPDHKCVVGARVVVQTAAGTQTRFVCGGGSYASSPDPRLHFGLGADRTIEKLTVHWPDGSAEEILSLTMATYHEIRKGTGERIK